MGPDIILETQIKKGLDPFNVGMTLNREHEFHTLAEIAVHHVCTGKIEFFLTVIPKLIGPVMLKKTANDRTDRNIFRQPLDSRTQATDPADNQIDFDASLGGLIVFFDHGLIDQGIHLGYEIGFLSRLGMSNFPIDQFGHPFPQAQGSHDELVEGGRLGITGKDIEKGRGILPKFIVCREKAKVRIELGRLIVVVSRPQMDIPFDAGFFLTHNESDLGMGLQPYKAIDDVTAGAFQTARPDNIVFFIKAGFQFHQGRHLLAVFRCFGKGRDNG